MEISGDLIFTMCMYVTIMCVCVCYRSNIHLECGLKVFHVATHKEDRGVTFLVCCFEWVNAVLVGTRDNALYINTYCLGTNKHTHTHTQPSLYIQCSPNTHVGFMCDIVKLLR